MERNLREKLISLNIPGFRSIFAKDGHISKRLIWTCLLLYASTFAMYQIYNQIVYFYERPVTVEVREKQRQTLPFPQVTFCNDNPVKQRAPPGAPDPVMASSFTLQELLVECSWSDEPCEEEDFVHAFTERGLCYTFNGNPERKKTQSSHGEAEFGFNIMLNANLEFNMYALYDGYRVLLSPHEYLHNMNSKAMHVPTGLVTRLSIKYIEEFNLEPPYGKCGKEKLTYFSDYQEVNCRRECWNMYLMSKCGCYELDLEPHLNSSAIEYNLCTPQEMESCQVHSVRFPSYLAEGQPCVNRCPRDCKRSMFDLIRPPTYSKISKALYSDFTGKYGKNETYWENNLVGLSVFYGSKLEKKILHQVAYTPLSLFCDIGGSLALLLGIGFYHVLAILDVLGIHVLRNKMDK